MTQASQATVIWQTCRLPPPLINPLPQDQSYSSGGRRLRGLQTVRSPCKANQLSCTGMGPSSPCQWLKHMQATGLPGTAFESCACAPYIAWRNRPNFPAAFGTIINEDSDKRIIMGSRETIKECQTCFQPFQSQEELQDHINSSQVSTHNSIDAS